MTTALDTVAIVVLMLSTIVWFVLYRRRSRELEKVYDNSTYALERFHEVMETATKSVEATAAYGAFMQQFAYDRVMEVKDPALRQDLLDTMSGARLQYLAMHPGGDTTDPDDYMFYETQQPPPLLEI